MSLEHILALCGSRLPDEANPPTTLLVGFEMPAGLPGRSDASFHIRLRRVAPDRTLAHDHDSALSSAPACRTRYLRAVGPSRQQPRANRHAVARPQDDERRAGAELLGTQIPADATV